MPHEKDQELEITSGDAARILGVTLQQVNRLAHAGKLPGKQAAGRFWIFKRGDVEAYKRQPKRKGGRPPKGITALE